jgi:serine/threonine protein kinase
VSEPDDLTQVNSPAANPATAETRLAEGIAPIAEDRIGQTTQFTQYSASHNHSAGFAKAKALVEQSVKGDGVGRLLKKRFLLESVLGHGGMGTVYKARDLRKVEAEDPNPYIATKVLNQDFRDHPDAFITLQQETAKSQTLAHPNIVTVHDFDRDGDTLYMTMELLSGEPLDQLIHQHKDKGLAKETVWSITKDLCAALAYAHERHLIHADFKPGNIFVTSEGRAKVLDFGIARAASKEAQKHKFDAGQLGALTPAYSTIEMINDEPISFSDDVYALACVVYEMLAGRHPYNHRSALDALAKDSKPKRPLHINNTEWKVLQRGLALKKKDRYTTINEFADALFPKPVSLGVKIAIGLTTISVIGASWFAYDQYQTQQELKIKIQSKMQQAQQCFNRQDYECAVAASLIAVNLAPQNPEANALLKQSQEAEKQNRRHTQITRLLKEANACVAVKDTSCVQVKAKEILNLDKSHKEGLALTETANQLQNEEALQSWLADGEKCLAANDLDCAKMFVEKALTLNPTHSSVINLQNTILGIESENAEQLAQKQAIHTKLLQEAIQCFNQKKYDCAISKANQILAQAPTHADAVALKQRSEIASQQQLEVAQKVKRLLTEAEDCMIKKNYACAIAKAESALDLSPESKEALAKKRKAQETQQKLKESGFNIR